MNELLELPPSSLSCKRKKMTNSKDPTPSTSTSTCFSTFLHHFICSNNLPTHPSPLHPLLHHHHTSPIVAPNTQAQAQPQSQPQIIAEEPSTINPGIIARLMGLDSLPNPHQNSDSLYRSKSLNSLRLLPGFDPARISLHRRAITSASFREHEIGHKFLAQIDENSELYGQMTEEWGVGAADLKRWGKERREKVVKLKGNDRRRNRKEKKSSGGKFETRKRELGFSHSSNVELIQSNVLSESPVSVLDHHHHHEFDSSSKGDSKGDISNSRQKSPRKKFRILDDKPPWDHIKLKFEKKNQGSQLTNGSWEDNKVKKAERVEVGEYFGEVLGQISKLAEERIRDPSKWEKKYQGLKAGFIQVLGKEFGHEILDFLLDELMHELIVS